MQLGRVSVVAPGTQAANGTVGPVRVRDHGKTVGFQIVISTASGGTQTVTWKWQGSFDGTNFVDVAYITDASNTSATSTLTKTATGTYVQFLDIASGARNYNYYQLVVTSVTDTIKWGADIYTDGR